MTKLSTFFKLVFCLVLLIIAISFVFSYVISHDRYALFVNGLAYIRSNSTSRNVAMSLGSTQLLRSSLKSQASKPTTTVNNSDGSAVQAAVISNSFKHVSQYTIDRQFGPKTRDSCTNESDNEFTLGETRTLNGWEKALTDGKVKGRPLFESNEYMFDWEKFYLSKQRLNDIKDLPDLNLSKVWFLNGDKVPVATKYIQSRRYKALTFRVDLVSSRGIQRTTGGDEIRVWLSEDARTGSGKRYSATGSTFDLGNGSYTVTVIPTWPGLTNLNIGVVYPREYIRAALHHSRTGSHRFIFGRFKQKDAEEVTICHSTPNVPGRPCVCNYTSWNILPFYCGRPLDARLKCKDWVSVWPAPRPPFKNLTSAEWTMANSMSRPAVKTLIRHNFVIKVTDDGDNPANKPCVTTNRSQTWDKPSPRGFWTKGPTWTSLICQEPEMTSKWAQACLRSNRILLIGDSNMVRIRVQLCSFLGCVYQPQPSEWPAPLVAHNHVYNITVFFRPHEYPLYLHRTWASLNLNGGIKHYLDDIPSSGSHVVIIHYYLHLSSTHLSAFQIRLIRLKEYLVHLLNRNSDVIVGIRGPHISAVQWTENHMFGGDVLASFMLQMIRETFQDMKNKIIFLDGWDMSISLKNEHMHPSNMIPRAMLRTLLAFKCS